MSGVNFNAELTFGKALLRVAVGIATICGICTSDERGCVAAERLSASVQPAPNSYCGLHCVYSVLRQHGVEIKFTELLDDQFLTDTGSSSAEDLCTALKLNGLEGRYVRRMAIDRLLLREGPTILHVRAPGVANHYHHWILYLGTDAKGVKVYDPPRQIGHYQIDELLAIWDGAAVVVTEPGHASTVSSALPWISPVVLSALALLVCSLLIAPGRAGTWGQLTVALVTAFLFHLCTPWGFVHGNSGIAAVQSEYFTGLVGTIAFDELHGLVDDTDTIIVDTRPQQAFEYSHIPGAINIPIGSSGLFLSASVEKLREYKAVVVYCQSRSCGWAESVGRQLAARGIQGVRQYSGGMNDWNARTHFQDG